MSDLNAQILKQVEFYFSNSNLPKDKFLNEELSANDGWVRLSVLASFARMKKMSEDVEVIAAACRESKELLEVSEDGLRVRRATPLPENLDLYAIYIKGFAQDQTIDDIMTFLTEKNMNYQCVRLRNYNDKSGKKFKGSIFVEFDSEEAATAALDIDLGEGYIIKKKADYDAEKKKEKKGSDVVDIKFTPSEFAKDLLIKFTGLYNQIRRETLKEWISNVGGNVAFIEFEQGLSQGVARLSEDSEDKATVVAEKLNAKIDELKTANNDEEVTIVALSGDDETVAWEAIEKAKSEKRASYGKRRPQHRDNFKGKRQRR